VGGTVCLCACSAAPPLWPPKYLRLWLRDSPDENIARHFARFNEWTDGALASHPEARVLFHCQVSVAQPFGQPRARRELDSFSRLSHTSDRESLSPLSPKSQKRIV
jgi:hypothetical protein